MIDHLLADATTQMPTSTYDAIVIGTGQAGPFVASRFAKAGMKVAIVERGLFGGTCVNTGCIPTKTMVASAYAAHMARRAAEFGVGVGGAVTRRHGAREGAEGRDLRPVAQRRRSRAAQDRELHGLPGPRALRIAARSSASAPTG